MPAAFARRSQFSGVEARPAHVPVGAVRAHASSIERRPVDNGIPFDGKVKCRGVVKKTGSACGAWAMPGTERCAGHTE